MAKVVEEKESDDKNNTKAKYDRRRKDMDAGSDRTLSGMAKGGKVMATGKRRLHKGELVARKSCRSKSRGRNR